MTVSLPFPLDETTCAVVNGEPVSGKVLRLVFGLVQNREHWKNPIDAVVPFAEFERVAFGGETQGPSTLMGIVREAVIFYAGCRPTVDADRGPDGALVLRVRAVGYFAAVGA